MDHFYSFYARIMIAAAVFVFFVSGGIYAATRRISLVRQYCTAHLIALLLGSLADVALIKILIPMGGIKPVYLNAVFITPIAFFIGFSTYLCHRDTVLHAIDILFPLSPIIAWGFLVVSGMQRGMGDFDVLGAWFVAAGCGGIDLAAHYGPPKLTARPYLTKVIGYTVMVAAVYVFLPWATA